MTTESLYEWWGDEYLVVEVSLIHRGPKPSRTGWVEFTISEPGVGPQGTELAPVAEGSVTLGGQEYRTIGSFDGLPLHLYQAVQAAYLKGKELLNGR